MVPITSTGRAKAGWRRAALAALVAAAVAAPGAGCGASAAEVREARTSGYDVDFAIVYSQTLAAVRDLYPQLTEDPTIGLIRTSWHPLRLRDGAEEGEGIRQQAGSADAPPDAHSLGVSGGDRLLYFIRFEIHVLGGRPWRVKLTGEASRWRVGEVPVPLKGADVPPWLAGREDALRLKIHKRLRQYAVPLRFEKSAPPEPEPVVAALPAEVTGNLPEEAARVVNETRRAALIRDAARLRELMADEFTWSRGGDAPQADIAVAMWQADTTLLGEMARILEAGCRADDSMTVLTCPPAASEDPGYRGFRAGFRLVGDAWKLSSFYSDD